MFVVLWEFDVKPGCENRFERIYGPTGQWAQLFQRDPHYLGTRLLRDSFRERIYLTIDTWGTREAYAAFQKENREAYAALDKVCENFTIAERQLGCYERIPENL